MWRRTILQVNGRQQAVVLNAVQSYFESSRRYGKLEWLERDRVLAAYGRRNLSTGRESVKVEVNGSDGTAIVQVDIFCVCAPIYDWGKSQRNIDDLLSHLRNAGFSFEVKANEGEHKIGGPNRYPTRVDPAEDLPIAGGPTIGHSQAEVSAVAGRKSVRSARIACAIGLVALVAGVVLVESKVSHQHWLRAHGVLIPATVTGQVTGCTSDGSNAYVPLRFFTSDRQRILVNLPAQGCPKLPVGSRTGVYYNPAQPTDAILKAAPDLDLAAWWEIILAIAGLVTLIIGSYLWYRGNNEVRSHSGTSQPTKGA